MPLSLQPEPNASMTRSAALELTGPVEAQSIGANLGESIVPAVEVEDSPSSPVFNGFDVDKAHEESEEPDSPVGGSDCAVEETDCPTITPQITLTAPVEIQGNRITWLVGLGKPLSVVFESPPFAMGTYGPVHFQLRPNSSRSANGRGCTLSLHGGPPRPQGVRVMLFAGKGWKKRVAKDWPEGEDLVEKFDVDLRGRSSILCGLAYQLGRR